MPRVLRRYSLAAATGLALLCVTMAVPSSPASAQINPDEIGRKLSETYKVRVLEIQPTQHDSRMVYAAKVMRTGADAGSAAFMVTTLLVDPMTGDLISAVEHGSSGYAISATDSHEARMDSSGSAMRRMTNRPSPRD